MLQLCLAANDRAELRGYIGITPDQPIVIGGYSAAPLQVEVWQFDPVSMAADDGVSVLKPTVTLSTDPGRYIRTSTTASAVKKSENKSGATNSSGNFTFTFSNIYTVAPNVQANIINASDTQIIKIGTPTTTGVTVTVRNRTDVVGLLPTWSNVNGASVDILVTEK